MRRWMGVAAVAALVSVFAASAENGVAWGAEEGGAEEGAVILALGLEALAEDGMGLFVGYRPVGSHWLYGFRYAAWTEPFHDPFTGRLHSDDSYAHYGPQVSYLFDVESPGSWYLAAGLFAFTLETKEYWYGYSDSDSATVLCLGGGYMYRLDDWLYLNLGMLVGGATLSVATTDGISMVESTAFDAQFLLGVSF